LSHPATGENWENTGNIKNIGKHRENTRQNTFLSINTVMENGGLTIKDMDFYDDLCG
jgi:hypothetical protein